MASVGLNPIVMGAGATGFIPDTGNADSPWSKQQVREAVEYALDKEGIAAAFGYGYLKAPYQLVPSDFPAYDPDLVPRKHDLEKAKALLAEAGYANGFKTTIIVSPMSAERNILAAIQANLAEVGIVAELEFPDFGKFSTYLFGSWNNGVIFTSIPADANYNQDLQFFNMWGKSWLRSPEYQAAAQASLDAPTADPKLMRSVAAMLVQQALVIPIVQDLTGYAVRPFIMDSGVDQRTIPSVWNTEDTWFNK